MASQGTAVDVLDHTQFLHQAQVLPERADLAPLPAGQLLMGDHTSARIPHRGLRPRCRA